MKEVKMSRNRRINFVFIEAVRFLLLLALTGILFAARVSASPNSSLPPLSSETGSLTVTFVSDDGIAIPNAEIHLAKVADFKIVDGKRSYQAEPDFIPLNIDYDHWTTDQSIEVADQVYRFVSSNKIRTNSARTDADGEARFTGLGNGMYEVFLNSSFDYSGKSYYFDPYLITIPEEAVDDNGTVISWKYDGKSIPKSQNVTEVPENPAPTPQITVTPPPASPPASTPRSPHSVTTTWRIRTGDAHNPALWIGLIAAALAGAAWLAGRKRKT